MSQAQAAALGAEVAAGTKTIQMNVLQRFMNDKEINTFMRSYREHRLRGKIDRLEQLEAPVTREEKKMLSAFLTETDLSTRELAEKFGMSSPGKYWFNIARAAIRILHQNKVDLA